MHLERRTVKNGIVAFTENINEEKIVW